MQLKPISKFLFLLLIVVFIGCSSRDQTSRPNDKYSLYIMNKNLGNTIVTVNSLDSGIVDILKQGINLPTQYFDRSIIIHDGYFYHIKMQNFANLKLKKMHYQK